ncbi:hypothetical protein [Bartonella doshiae]|uniref:Uncharacterized protein n=2 Tax=Bartonella doshiae TaxID=33044 RepID=A0A380ZGQ7_BARDO|nr:hypothetical protein [Bartonella doshiae]EJF79836.1 hypothetical protein MCS_01304 [Bartonella doshiae NCTC 12862 = ATCC 700133]MBB6158970.1 hypothetical protein [Bartonella doshiae]SUV45492.1 Uncharacterised protein [Bartonella doshiae]
MWIKAIQKGLQLPLINPLKVRAVATLEAGKYNDDAGLLLHKRKDESA